jgi:hypothetical protein
MPERVAGLALSRRLYLEAVRPILDTCFPRFEHAAALIGTGSEVLGYDDAISTDHHWGPRVQLFVRHLDGADDVASTLARDLPNEFLGYPTNFGEADELGVRLLAPVERGPVAHRVEILETRSYLRERLGFDPLDGIAAADWLLTPSEILLELTSGDVFADPVGDLTAARHALAFYPDNVWRVVMAGWWRRISQLEHFVGRTGSRGDELGSRVIAASLARDLMRLAFVQERRYAPYAKWLGTAYAELDRPEAAALAAALDARDWPAREIALAEAYRLVAEAHNALGVTQPLDPRPRPFHGRAFLVLDAGRFATALAGPTVGAIDAVTDNTDVLTANALWRRLAGLYDRTEIDGGDPRDGM